MAIYVVADLHGSPDALKKAVPEGATLLLLGDLINFIDYRTMTGILVDVFSVEAVEKVVRLRTAGRVKEARRIMRERAVGREEEVSSSIGRRVRAQYREVFRSLMWKTFFVLGNVDNLDAALSASELAPDSSFVHGKSISLEGERFGFVGGALPTPLHAAGEISEEEMRGLLDGLGEVDVVCTHIPPAVDELCYDTRARKFERGSRDLLEYIRDVQPRFAYFGHVHQPMLSSMAIGDTQCINVGYFRSTRRAWPHRGPLDR